MTPDARDLALGARNLLQQCGGFTSGGEILIVCEDPALGWYDEALGEVICGQARELGLIPRTLVVGAPSDPLSPEAEGLIESHGNCIYLARIGDQDRFAEILPGKTKVMCYVRTPELLASAFGTTSHRAMQALKKAVDRVLLSAGRIEIVCPLGSRVSGAPSGEGGNSAEVSVQRFPLGVPHPLPAQGFSGEVVLARYLTPTGSQPYDPPFIAIEGQVVARIEQGRIASFSGDAAAVASVERHYERVSKLFDIDPAAIHSWHAGLHPGCAYPWAAAEDPDRWSNTVFNNPRVLHFHTCGAYAPGEICWMLLDHSVYVDGVALWEDGRLRPERLEQTRACLEEWPELTLLFENPSRKIGL